MLKFILAEPLTEEEAAQKDAYIEEGFPDWSRRDFQQFVKGLEAYGWWAMVLRDMCRLG
jgi:hypothetical protein